MSLSMSIRRMREAPGFSVAVLLTVAMVVTVNASAFAGWWALLYKPLPIAQAEDWTELRIDLRDINFQVGLSPSLFGAVRDATQTFDAAIGAAELGPPVLDEQARPWHVQRITPDFARVLGVTPARGVALNHSAETDLLLSDRSWRERFNADANILGRQIRIGKSNYRIVGVMPPGFAWPDADVQAWTPWVATPIEREQDAVGGFGQFHVAARLAPGVGLVQAQQTLSQLLAASNNAFLSANPDRVRAQARPWRERFSAGHVAMLLMLQAAAALLLLVAAANLTGLTIDRLWSHRRAYAIRHALGARPGDLFGLILSDLALPSVLGVAIGLLLTPTAVALLADRGLLPSALPLAVGSDWPTLGVGTAAGGLVLCFAVVAAQAALRRFARGALSERAPVHGIGRAQAIALVVQIALTTALAGASGLLLRSAANLADEPRGFDPNGVLLTQIELPAGIEQKSTMTRLQTELAGIAGVQQVAITTMPPFGGAEFLMTVALPGSTQTLQARAPFVGAGYFQTLRIPIIAGRDFTAEEIANGKAVIVDENFKRHWLPNGSVPGSSLQIIEEDQPPTQVEIVGVVAAVKQKALDEEAGQPLIYSPLAFASNYDFFIIRTALDAGLLADQVRRVLASQAPDAKLMVNVVLADAVARTLQTRRALLESLSLFGLATLALAALGLYAVLSAAVARRSAEFGVRMALGSAPGLILRLVMRQAGALIGLGLALGVLLGLALATLLASQLHRLATSDVSTWAFTALAIALVGLLACAIPARRATRVSPRVALDTAPQAFRAG